MKQILYLMHIPWGWIKQRPHFFAEKLAKDIIVDVKYKQPFKVAKKHLLTSKSETFVYRKFPHVSILQTTYTKIFYLGVDSVFVIETFFKEERYV